MVASTNHLDQLDPGLSSRPSRFDRKYLFPLPSTEERVLYCEYWRSKLASKPSIKFPKKLCPAIADITEDFSFAYLKEAFVATLLVIAGNRSEDSIRGGGDDEGGDLDDYELWREMKKQVKALRDDMDSRAAHMDKDPICLEDLSWKDYNLANNFGGVAPPPVPAQQSQCQLPYRVKGHGKKLPSGQQSPRFLGRSLDCDIQQAPFMTEDGMLMDSRLDRIGGLELQ